MKQFKIFLGVALTLIVVLVALIADTLATNPTVTATSITSRASTTSGVKGYQILQFSFPTTIAAADTAIIYFNTALSASQGLVGFAGADSVIAMTLGSTETSADSIRFTIIHQISAKASPSTASDYGTVITDATGFANTISGYSAFRPLRYGLFYRHRVLIAENDTNKDASQTVTVRAIIPLP